MPIFIFFVIHHHSGSCLRICPISIHTAARPEPEAAVSWGDPREIAWLEDALRWLKVYEVDEEAVADVQARRMEEGNPVPGMDLLVALSAKRGSGLMTLDEDHSGTREALQSKGVTVSFLEEPE